MTEYPEYCLHPERPHPDALCGDVVAYLRGTQLARLHEPAAACASFSQVLHDWPQSSIGHLACHAMRRLDE